MSDYNLNDPADAELVSYGMEECRCDATTGEDLPSCVVCLTSVRSIGHVHYKGQAFHDFCLLLALLRELNGKKDDELNND